MPEIALQLLLGGLVAAFALVSGANDGGVLLAMGTRYSGLTLRRQIAGLAVVLVAVPMTLGVAVARTLAEGLLTPSSSDDGAGLLLGVAWAIVIVLVLSRAGIPTSLSLALVGGLAGAAAGSGADVAYATVWRVLVIAAIAPLLAAILGWGLDHVLRLTRPMRHANRGVGRVHAAAFLTQTVAYALNDGQKMLAVAAIALTGSGWGGQVLGARGWPVRLAVLAGLTAFFVLGTLWTLRPVTHRIGFDLAQLRPLDGVSAEFLSGAVVLGSAALGMPVSMSQALTGAVVGLSGSKGRRRVRWASAGKIAVAWVVTLPASIAGAYLAGLIVKVAA